VGVVKTLYDYWFRFGNPTAFGVIRILISSFIFINFVMMAVYFQDLFGNNGYMPADLCARWLDTKVYLIQGSDVAIPRINLLYGITNDTIILAFYWLTAIASLTSAFGFKTRLSTILMAVGVVSLHHRNPMLLHGGDTAMRVAACYLAVGPAGAALSLDRWWGLKKGTITGAVPLVSMWPQRLMQFNVSLIYFTTMWAKWFGGLWKSGDATWYPARLNEFDRFYVPPFLDNYPMVKVTTYGTLFVEFALGTLVWFKPLRKWVLLAGIGLHSFIEYSMNIPMFAVVMVSLYLSFYEGEEVEAWWSRLKSRFKKQKA
jgi:hypothetical protein